MRVDGRAVAYAAHLADGGGALDLTVADERAADAVAEAARRSFLTPGPDFAALRRRDRLIARLDRRHPGFRPLLYPDLTTALIRLISAQQVNLRWAATTRRRLAERFGARHQVGDHTVYSLDADRIAEVEPADIRALQFTTRKAEYIVGAARAVADGTLDASALDGLDDEPIIDGITAVRGLGRWTAEWVLARTLGRPRVVAGDLGVRKAVGKAYLADDKPDERQVRAATAHWGAAAASAQALLLHGLAEGTLNEAAEP